MTPVGITPPVALQITSTSERQRTRLCAIVCNGAPPEEAQNDRGLKCQASRQLFALWSWGESTHRNSSDVSVWTASARGIRPVCLSSKSVSVWLRAFCDKECDMRRADQEGLVQDHSGGFRIEPLRPDGVFVGFHPSKVRTGEVRPHEVRTGEVRIGEVRIGEVRPSEVRTGEFRPHEVRPWEFRLHEARLPEFRPGEVRPFGGHRPGEVRTGEVRTGEVSPSEVRTGEVRTGEVRPHEVRHLEVRPFEIRTGEVRTGEVRHFEVRPREVRPHKHYLCQCCCPKVRMAQIDVSEIAVRQVDIPEDSVRTIKRPVDFFKTSTQGVSSSA
jgi:hypothetical protein